MKKIKLGEICVILKGTKLQPVEQNEQAVRLIQIDDLRNDDNYKFCVPGPTTVIAEPNDIIIAWDGANAGTVRFGLKGAIGSTLAIIRLKNNIFDPRFTGFLLKRKFDYLQRTCTGATIPHINRKALEDIEVPFLPIPQQKNIVRQLELSSEILAMRKQQLAELDNLIKSIFYDMFGDPVTNEKGWDVASLGAITLKIGSGATPRGGKQSYKDSGISLIRSMNVYNGIFMYDELAHIDEEQAKQLNNVTVEENDVLLNITGASVARSCIVPKDVLPARVNQHVSIIRANEEIILPEYLNALFTFPSFQEYLLSLANAGGATREALTKQQLIELRVAIPPLNFQQKYAEIFLLVESERALLSKSIDETQYLFDSLMSRYFD